MKKKTFRWLPMWLALICGCSSNGGSSNTNLNSSDNDNTSVNENSTATFALGSGVDVTIDPSPFGMALEDENQELVPDDEALPVDALPLTDGPQGTVLGLALDDGTRLFLLGTMDVDAEEVAFTGVVLEDVQGNLIFRQDVREAGTTLTYATGDAVDLDASGDGLRLTYMLNGTDPPSTFVIDIDPDGEAILLEDESTLYGSLNDAYNEEPIRLPRATAVGSARLANQDEAICFLVNAANNLVEGGCTLWSLITAKGATRALDVTCTTINGFLDEVRGSSPFPNLPGLPADGPEILPQVTAGVKIGVSTLCAGLKGGWSAVKLFKKLSPPDLFCLSVSLSSELGRLIAPNGQSMATNICEAAKREFGDPEPLPPLPHQDGCSDDCETAQDGSCDDGGPFAASSSCEYGGDCQDCGVRSTLEPPPTADCSDDGICNLDCPLFDPDIDCTSLQLCSAKEVCCPDDGVCDITSCTTVPDPDCGNLQYCDRQGACCPDDDFCDSTDLDCPQTEADCALCAQEDDVCIRNCVPEDPDCAAGEECPTDGVCDTDCTGADPDCDLCGSGDSCVAGCTTPDPDCAVADCPADFDCDTSCAGTDPDCAFCGEDGECVSGCTTEDPDCTIDEGSFVVLNFINFDGSSSGAPDITLSGDPTAPTINWSAASVFALTVTSGFSSLFGIEGRDDEDNSVTIPSGRVYGDYSGQNIVPLAEGGGSAPPLTGGTLYSITLFSISGQAAILNFQVAGI